MGGGPLRWRLLSGNHKALGICVDGYEDEAALWRALAEVRAAAHDGEHTVDPSGDRWAWSLVGPAGVVATNHSPFARRVDAETSVIRFCASAEVAEVSPRVVVFPAR